MGGAGCCDSKPFGRPCATCAFDSMELPGAFGLRTTDVAASAASFDAVPFWQPFDVPLTPTPPDPHPSPEKPPYWWRNPSGRHCDCHVMFVGICKTGVVIVKFVIKTIYWCKQNKDCELVCHNVLKKFKKRKPGSSEPPGPADDDFKFPPGTAGSAGYPKTSSSGKDDSGNRVDTEHAGPKDLAKHLQHKFGCSSSTKWDITVTATCPRSG